VALHNDRRVSCLFFSTFSYHAFLSPHSKLLPRSVMSPSSKPVPDLRDAADGMSEARDGAAERYAP
jgi:hypothetical protein